MATKAKRPKQEAQEQERFDRLTRAQMILRVTPEDTDVTFDYPAFNIPARIRGDVFKVTGHTVEEMVRGGIYGYVVAWWITRMCSGEKVTLRQVENEWDERCAGTTLDSLDTDWINAGDPVGDPEADSPEG